MFKKTLIWMISAVVLMVVITVTGMFAINHLGGGSSLAEALSNHQWVFMFWRYLCLSILVWQWPNLCQAWGRKNDLKSPEVKNISRRIWVIGFVVVIEILIKIGG